VIFVRGRPKQEVTRSAKILIRLFPREKKLIRDIAKKYGVSISDCIRVALTQLVDNPEMALRRD
jgi:antitoxin component of RelBE/YafQ-DinJ toxin-antitoxin module